MEPAGSLFQREEQLGEILSEWLEALESGQIPDRREWLSRHPEFADELEEFLDQHDRFRSLAAPFRAAMAAEQQNTPMHSDTSPNLDVLTQDPENLPGPFGDYELLMEIGRGGMAIVYRARQKSLGRFVALKLFRKDLLRNEGDLQRFRLEAETVARLDHPAIVPVFELGEHPPYLYFTMKLIEGGSLDKQIRRFSADARAAAGLVARCARGVHHAHQRGILHRDLKPSNILLTGSADAPLESYLPGISDFGLAKRLEQDVGLTHTGAVVGTPAYMAPEQAAGDKAAATTAADVYGLGAVLYALLTGTPPFRGDSILDTLNQVRERDPQPPRRINPRLPRDLETICLKCLHKEPQRRYETAAAVAEDLERWLNDEPILARPVGPLGRLWRWRRRQPVQAGLWAALLVALATGFALVFWQWRRAEHLLARTDVLRQEAVDHERESDENFHLAHDSVREFSTLLDAGNQLEEHGLDPLRLALLKKSQAYYERFLERRGNDPALRLELAQASATLAEIIRQTGTPDEAIVALEQAVHQAELLSQSDPENLSFVLGKASLLNQIGCMHNMLGHRDAGIATVRQAAEILELHLQERPEADKLTTELASTHHNLGLMYADMNRVDEAISNYDAARRLHEKLTQAHPDVLELQSFAANTLNSIGTLRLQMGDARQALEPLRKAAAISERLVALQPEKRALQNALALNLSNLAECHLMLRQPHKALANAQRAHKILQDLTKKSPHITGFQESFGLCCTNLGRSLQRVKRAAEATESFEKAGEILRQLAKTSPGVPKHQIHLVQALLYLGQAYVDQGQPDKANDVYREARDVSAPLARAHPDKPELTSRLAFALQKRAMILADSGQLDEARLEMLQAVKWESPLLARGEPHRLHLSDHLAVLAAIERQLGHFDEAVADSIQRRELAEAGEPAELYLVAKDFALTGSAAAERPATRQRCADLAMSALGQAMKRGFRDAEKVRDDPALELLRARDDFQKLLLEMGKPPS